MQRKIRGKPLKYKEPITDLHENFLDDISILRESFRLDKGNWKDMSDYLFSLAFTHKSFLMCPVLKKIFREQYGSSNYEIFEFIGDRVLYMITTQYLMERNMSLLTPRNFTELMVTITRNSTLECFYNALDGCPNVLKDKYEKDPKICADTFESLVGVLYFYQSIIKKKGYRALNDVHIWLDDVFQFYARIEYAFAGLSPCKVESTPSIYSRTQNFKILRDEQLKNPSKTYLNFLKDIDKTRKDFRLDTNRWKSLSNNFISLAFTRSFKFNKNIEEQFKTHYGFMDNSVLIHIGKYVTMMIVTQHMITLYWPFATPRAFTEIYNRIASSIGSECLSRINGSCPFVLDNSIKKDCRNIFYALIGLLYFYQSVINGKGYAALIDIHEWLLDTFYFDKRIDNALAGLDPCII